MGLKLSFPILILIWALLAGCGAARPEGEDRSATDVAAARAALAAGDAAGAIALAGPLSGENMEARGVLAEARLAHGSTLVAEAGGAAEPLRAALDQFNLALADAPATGPLREEILARQRETLALLEPPPAPAATAVAQPEPGPAAAPVAAQPRPAPRPDPRPAQPATPSFGVVQRNSFEGAGNSGQYESCIDIQVLGQGGPIAGAVIGINNGEHSYQNQTDGNGYTGRCGLGASTWSVVLFWAPPDRSISGAATTVYVSGAPEQRAAVVFQER